MAAMETAVAWVPNLGVPLVSHLDTTGLYTEFGDDQEGVDGLWERVMAGLEASADMDDVDEKDNEREVGDGVDAIRGEEGEADDNEEIDPTQTVFVSQWMVAVLMALGMEMISGTEHQGTVGSIVNAAGIRILRLPSDPA
ncbi:hypothetical protein CBR_g39476 [Chara braunii]|uniref:Uncharacterized protein n=1 Tax=Chara braunii TaxID=69332 RepID=A0A388LS33_CHABU|nr:hypothetical protein CBR_g39476 [Chara braunii]|eukprot:GBG85012.1 hypothetical protein CBR_g39476 [Chara braunii]